ncbi:hypothetical protein [Dyella sp. 2HG41-7]|uniref:hypothetical protein n=1 Tax=Dyella sp. 2HG41-7 TaxID=2883239 RepID=UPI001F279BCD|nr:hypothetical protein [Dyella sp. 2HG41-7]
MNKNVKLDKAMVYVAYGWMFLFPTIGHFDKALGSTPGWWPTGVASLSLFYCLAFTLWRPTPFSYRWRRWS